MAEVKQLSKRKLKDVPKWMRLFHSGTRVSNEERKLLDTMASDIRDLFFGGLFDAYLEKKFEKSYEKSVDRVLIRINKWQKKYSKVKLEEVK